MEQGGSEGMQQTSTVSIKYRYMKPHFKGLTLTLENWRPYIDEKGWILWGEELKTSELEGGWEGIQEADKPNLIMGVTQLKQALLDMMRLTEDQVPLWRQPMTQIQAVEYLMGYAGGLGFELVIWGQGEMVSEPGKSMLMYQGRS